MLKQCIKYSPNFIPFLNPFIFDEINRMGEYCGINRELHRDNEITVSLSAQKTQYKYLPKVIYSLLNQTLKPDRLILWLDEETDDITTLPYEITMFIKNGLEIKFIKNINSYNKTIYALKNFGNSIIVTANSNIYYRKDWLKRLYISYIANPDDIHVHNARRVVLDTNKNELLIKANFRQGTNEESAGFDKIPFGEGGVLYPPQCFNNDVFRKDIFLQASTDNDSLWFWAMALVRGRKIRVVKNHYNTLLVLDFIDYFYEKIIHSNSSICSDAVQLRAIMKYYGQNIINKLKHTLSK